MYNSRIFDLTNDLFKSIALVRTALTELECGNVERAIIISKKNIEWFDKKYIENKRYVDEASSPKISPGSIVVHPKYGPGIFIECTDCAEARVVFSADDGCEIVNFSELLLMQNGRMA